jgi:hypothetical protein
MLAQAMYEKEIYGEENEASDSMASSFGSESSFATTRASHSDDLASKIGESRLLESIAESTDQFDTEEERVPGETMNKSLRQSVDGSWVKDVDSFRPTDGHLREERQAESRRHNPTNENPLQVVMPQSIEQEEGYEGMAVQDVNGGGIELKNGQHLDMPNHGTPDNSDEKIQRELKQAMEDELRTNGQQDGPAGSATHSSEQKAFKLKTSDTHPIK